VALTDINAEGAQAGGEVLRVAEQVGWGSLICAGWVLAACLSMLLSCRFPDWRRQHLVWCVFFLSGSQVCTAPRHPPRSFPPSLVRHRRDGGFWGAGEQVAYLVLSTVCTPPRFGQE
jgi:hypothetical protein